MTESTRQRIGTVLAGKYRLDRELGRGGMGAVYRAFHLRVHKEFAVKLLIAEVAAHPSIAQRFVLEAQAAGRIGHPGILDVYDVGEDDKGTPFIVMELLKGEPLGALLRRHRLAPAMTVWIAEQVLEILDAAHKAGVIHRDVKPQNVFLCEAPDSKRTVKLLDFGIAKFASGPDASAITRSGEIIGSPLYMAPEQAKGEVDVDVRADVWSVGAMLFEMLTGKAAHAASTPVAVLAKILTEPVPPPSGAGANVPPELDAIVQRALSIDRDARFESARAMLEALRALRKKLGWPDTTPVFPAVEPPPALVDTKADSGSVTSTVEAPASSQRSGEPSLEAAVTNDRARIPKARPWAMVAVAALGIAVAVPFVLSNNAKPPAPAASVSAPPPASVAPPPTASTVAVTATPTPSDVPAPSASAAASAPGRPAITIVPSKPASPPPPANNKPQCAATEVLSNGHCCPRGLAWQDGRCERPLATSF